MADSCDLCYPTGCMHQLVNSYLYTMQATHKTLQWDRKQLENMFSFEINPLHPPALMTLEHDFIRRRAHSLFKGLAKLIKKAHLLQWPSTRHWRPGMLCIVLIAYSNHDWNIILFRNANCLPFHGVGLQAMCSSCEQKMVYYKHDIFHCPCLWR